ncbi:piggyBac transposable element-derived protein 3-like [Aphis craccivora]|uniref:PiggyBac transposable element-derived protein 3-like n=1 Tax=Aphis craccivora TaxID=307492 RepID=A0A6G0Y2T9_APHCR|nr:piggyBac transposable element-derived protein 3-like [Aphis craccivora]
MYQGASNSKRTEFDPIGDTVINLCFNYPHGFKNKKWYLRVFFHFLNVSIINSWILYREKCTDIPLLNFKTSIVWTMLQIGKHSGPKRGRKSLTQTPTPPKKRKKVRVTVPKVQ